MAFKEFLSPILKGALGIGQFIGGLSMNPKLPKYDIPDSMLMYLQKAKEMANQTRLPAQDLMEANLRQTTQGALGKAQEIAGGSGNLLGALGDIYGKETQGVNQLNIAAGQNYNANQRGLMQAQQTMAGYEDKKFKLNELDPYLRQASTKSALLGAGLSNLGGAASEYTNILLAKKNYELMEKLYGGGSKDKNIMPQQDDVLPDVTNFLKQYPMFNTGLLNTNNNNV